MSIQYDTGTFSPISEQALLAPRATLHLAHSSAPTAGRRYLAAITLWTVSLTLWASALIFFWFYSADSAFRPPTAGPNQLDSISLHVAFWSILALIAVSVAMSVMAIIVSRESDKLHGTQWRLWAAAATMGASAIAWLVFIVGFIPVYGKLFVAQGTASQVTVATAPTAIHALFLAFVLGIVTMLLASAFGRESDRRPSIIGRVRELVHR